MTGLLKIAGAILLMSSAAFGAERAITLHDSVSGSVAKPIAMRINTSGDGAESYRIRLGGTWKKGVWKGSGVDPMHVLLIDMNFDGHADVWVTGFVDGQARERPSDVWLYQPAIKSYRYDPALSALTDIEVDLGAKTIASGVSNCGCGGQCFFHEEYVWVKQALQKTLRNEQDCSEETIVYQEWRRSNDAFSMINRVVGPPSEDVESSRRKNSLNVVDWRKYDETGHIAASAKTP